MFKFKHTIKIFLCKIGVHRPLKSHRFAFTDMRSDKAVYRADCHCGCEWLVDSKNKWLGFKCLHRFHF